jgi:hypothetical protein
VENIANLIPYRRILLYLAILFYKNENKRIQNLTAEIAEHAEGTMAKAQGPGGKGRNSRICSASRKAKKPPRDLQEKISALSASSSVIFYLLVLIHGGTGERKIFIPQNEKMTTNRREPGGRREENNTGFRFPVSGFRLLTLGS